jgi:hypothetical protein
MASTSVDAPPPPSRLLTRICDSMGLAYQTSGLEPSHVHPHCTNGRPHRRAVHPCPRVAQPTCTSRALCLVLWARLDQGQRSPGDVTSRKYRRTSRQVRLHLLQAQLLGATQQDRVALLSASTTPRCQEFQRQEVSRTYQR